MNAQYTGRVLKIYTIMKRRSSLNHATKDGAIFRSQDRENINWFWRRYLKKRTPWLILIFFAVAVQGIVYQQFLQITENGLRVIFENSSIQQLALICLYVFILFSVRAGLSYPTPRLTTWLASNAVLEMRKDVITHLLTLDLAYFERITSGQIILKLVTQINGLSDFFGHTTIHATRNFVTVLSVSAYLTYKSPLLFGAAVIVIPVIVIMMQIVARRIKIIQHSAQQMLGDYMSDIEEMTGG